MTTPLERASAAHLEAVIRDELARNVLHDGPRRARARRCAGAVGAPVACAASGRTGSRSRSRSTSRSRAGTTAALVNTQGEVFVADYDGELPRRSTGRTARRRGRPPLPRVVARRSRRWRSR